MILGRRASGQASDHTAMSAFICARISSLSLGIGGSSDVGVNGGFGGSGAGVAGSGAGLGGERMRWTVRWLSPVSSAILSATPRGIPGPAGILGHSVRVLFSSNSAYRRIQSSLCAFVRSQRCRFSVISYTSASRSSLSTWRACCQNSRWISMPLSPRRWDWRRTSVRSPGASPR
jgi:hypothetical protein